MSEKKKYLNIGSVLQFDEGSPFISLDNSMLKEFVEYLKEFGEKNLKGLTVDEIREKTKSKEIPRITINYYNPGEKAPSIIKKNLAIKLES